MISNQALLEQLSEELSQADTLKDVARVRSKVNLKDWPRVVAHAQVLRRYART